MKNIKVSVKLTALISAIGVVFIILCYLSMLWMKNIDLATKNINENIIPAIDTAHCINTTTSDYRLTAVSHIYTQDKDIMAKCEEMMSAYEKEINSDIATYKEKYATNDSQKELIGAIEDAWKNYYDYTAQSIALSNDGNAEEAKTSSINETNKWYTTLSEKCIQLVNSNIELADAAQNDADVIFHDAQQNVFLFGIILLVATAVVSTLLIRTITVPIRMLDRVAKGIGEGDLNQSITYQSKSEIGTLAVNFNKTVLRLKEYVNYIDEVSNVLDEIADGNLQFTLKYEYEGKFSKIKDSLENISKSLNYTLGNIDQSASQVLAGSEQVSAGAQALSQGATEQASSIEELQATVTTISQQVTENAKNSVEATEKVNTLGGEIEISNQQMQKMIKAMGEISDTSNEISKIIRTIEDIAFQTNILALNAAVEAARAGEAGKGFAVVAEEVRNLASKSAEAANNTTELIEKSIASVDDGAKIADATAKSLIKVVKETEDVVANVDVISKASQTQADAIKQVTIGIEQISTVVQTNSATAEESAAASEELSSQAHALNKMVGRFKLNTTADSSSQVEIVDTPKTHEEKPEHETPVIDKTQSQKKALKIDLDDDPYSEF